MMKTLESRRISSASASRIASANVISRVSTVYILTNLAGIREGSLCGKFDACGNFGLNAGAHLLQVVALRQPFLDQPGSVELERVALRDPFALFLLGTVIGPIDVSHVMPAIAIRVKLQEIRSKPLSRAFDGATGGGIDGSHILPITYLGGNPECLRTSFDFPRRGFAKMCVLVVHIVLADIDHRELPDGGHVHDLVQQPLTESSFAKKAH